MRINWKLRLQNKTTLLAIITLAISIVYQILHTFGVIPSIEQQSIVNIVTMIVDLLALLGIVVDPTTKGIGDSERAMHYTEPN